MGEYGTVGGVRVKLGTCEDYYWVRESQRKSIADYSGLRDAEVLSVVRFRFPWPDEDGTPAGDFGDDYDRGLKLWGVPVPDDVEHGLVQFSAANGYLVSLPCPEGPNGDSPEYVVHRNGYGGACSLVQQGWRGGRLVGIARCNGCGARYRLEDEHEVAVAVAIRAMGDERLRDKERYNEAADRRGDPERVTGDNGAGFYQLVADRLLAGYRWSLEA